MISFEREGAAVNVKVEHGIFFNNGYFSLPIYQSHDYQAALLCRQLNENLGNKLEAIRQEAYTQGWKDAKAKCAKKTWFSRTFK